MIFDVNMGEKLRRKLICSEWTQDSESDGNELSIYDVKGLSINNADSFST